MKDLCAEFDRLVGDYYGAWFHYHPEAAVDVGVEGYADRLAPHGDDDIGALVNLNEMILSALDELPRADLDADRQMDFDILYGAALIEHHELVEWDWRWRDPGRFLPVQAIYQLTVRPVVDFASALRARLEQIPAHLRSARAHLSTAPELIPPLWAETAINEAAQGADYLRSLAAHPKVVRAFPSRARITQALDAAARSLDEFATLLESEIAPNAAGDFACGVRHFERILRQRHFLDVSAPELHSFGQRLFASTAEQLSAVTRRLRGDADVAALTASICADHPSAADLLPAYREQMRAAHDFVRRHDLVTLPETERLQVIETPNFLRHQIPFAAYLQPAPNDPEQGGYYYVTPADDDRLLAEHNHAALMHTCAHEAWPGHHLQFVTAHSRPASRSLPRLLNPSATLYEGWALYCEQLMHEQGFLHRPEQEFILLRDRLWRALRVQLDVELQTGNLSVDAAATRMQEALGFPREQAMADLIWYTRAPGVPMGYATGWALITDARARLQRQNADMSLKDFHDRLLASGSAALPLVLDRGFGTELWQQTKNAVFGVD